MAKTLAEIDRVLDKVGERLDGVSERLDRVAERQEQNERDIAAFVVGVEKMKLAIETSNVKFEKIAKKIDSVGEMIGNLGGKFGFIVEMLLIPGICSAINVYGHNFTRICPDVKLHKKNKNMRTQIDLLLYDTTEVMAVEIKSQLDKIDVKEHLERLKKIRALEKELDLKGRTLFGAVAAIEIDRRARELALDNGLYVVEIQEVEDRLKTDAPAKGKVGKW